jgi:restriction endonuclease S subunit
MCDGWIDTILSEVVTVSRERVDPSRLEPDCELIHWSIPQLDESGGPSNVSASQIGSHKFSVLKDSVLYSLLNPRIPRFAKVKGGDSVVCSTEFAVLQPHSMLNIDFLFCFVSSPIFQDQVRSLAKGTTKSRERIDNKEIAQLSLRLPPIPEQKRIVDLVSSIDAYIEAVQKQLESAKKARNAVLYALLKAGDDGYVQKTLGEVAMLQMGRTPSRRESKYWTQNLDLPFCTITDMDSKFVDPKREGITNLAIQDGKAKVAKRGTLLMSFKLTIGRMGFAARDIYPNEAIVMIEANEDEVLNDFLFLSLGSMDLTEGSGRAVKGATLNSASIAAISLLIPPLAEQKRVVDILSSMDEMVTEVERTLKESRNTRSALLSNLLNGKHEIPISYEKVMGAA